MNKKAAAHFKKVDPILYKYVLLVGDIKTDKVKHLFEDLVSSIIGQQLSGKVADVIFARFKKLLKEKITPEGILKLSDEEIRSVGTSYAKVNSLKDLAFKVKKKEVELEKMDQLTDLQVIDELIKVKGIGPWTAEMFLMFTLEREDIFSYGDLGLRNAIKKIYGLNDPSKEDVAKIISKWSPFKTYACRILWKSLDL